MELEENEEGMFTLWLPTVVMYQDPVREGIWVVVTGVVDREVGVVVTRVSMGRELAMVQVVLGGEELTP